MNETIPEGYVPHGHRSPLTDPWEPLYSKTAERALRLAVRVREAHCNSRKFVHGGLIGALADNAMGLSVGLVLRGDSPQPEPHRGVTVNLAMDFLGSAQIGQWLEFQPRVLKVGKNLAFVDCVVLADSQVIARANATFRIQAT